MKHISLIQLTREIFLYIFYLAKCKKKKTAWKGNIYEIVVTKTI